MRFSVDVSVRLCCDETLLYVVQVETSGCLTRPCRLWRAVLNGNRNSLNFLHTADLRRRWNAHSWVFTHCKHFVPFSLSEFWAGKVSQVSPSPEERNMKLRSPVPYGSLPWLKFLGAILLYAMFYVFIILIYVIYIRKCLYIL